MAHFPSATSSRWFSCASLGTDAAHGRIVPAVFFLSAAAMADEIFLIRLLSVRPFPPPLAAFFLDLVRPVFLPPRHPVFPGRDGGRCSALFRSRKGGGGIRRKLRRNGGRGGSLPRGSLPPSERAR